jgi:hypothetical protein
MCALGVALETEAKGLEHYFLHRKYRCPLLVDGEQSKFKLRFQLNRIYVCMMVVREKRDAQY